mmetsp:Transcript_91621/g.163071  ORF Transcript_91621/g.163071 Transcript_91621/m.163071 type:complete len:289 (+) Transcript_91621:20-886(+)
MLSVALAMSSFAASWAAEDCQTDPFAIGCGRVQSKPILQVLYNHSSCAGYPVANATVGGLIYSSRPVFSVSNEQALCYSTTDFPGLLGPVRSFRWSCEDNGAVLVQTPFLSDNCSGEEALSENGRSQRSRYSSGLWSQVLDSKVCLTEAGVRGRSALRFTSEFPPSARPLCVQNFQTLQGELIEYTSGKTTKDSELQHAVESSQKWRSKLRQVEASREDLEDARSRERILFFLVGLAVGVVTASAAAVFLASRCRATAIMKESRGREMLPWSPAEDTGYAAFEGGSDI